MNEAIKKELDYRREIFGNGFKIIMKYDNKPMWIWYQPNGFAISFNEDELCYKRDTQVHFTNIEELAEYLSNYGKKSDVANIKNELTEEEIKKLNILEIWQPKYKTNSVYIAKYKVKKGINYITFTKAKHLDGMIFKVDSSIITKCPTSTNGKIDVYDVPFEKLERVF